MNKPVFSKALGLDAGAFATFTGGGGKTTLLFRLMGEYATKGYPVLGTTTTKMAYPKDFEGPILLRKGASEADFCQQIMASRAPALYAADHPLPQRKVSGLSVAFLDHLAQACPGLGILCEGDGSATKPYKLYRPWEPVIPGASTRVFHLIGCEIWGEPLENFIHRYPQKETTTPCDGPWLAAQFDFYRRHIRPLTPLVPQLIINKADGRMAAAQAMAEVAEPYFEQVFIASLQEEWIMPWSSDSF